MSWFKKKDKMKGLVWISGVGGGLLNKGVRYEGYFEVEVLEEFDGLCKIKFDSDMLERQNEGKWIEKKLINLKTKRGIK